MLLKDNYLSVFLVYPVFSCLSYSSPPAIPSIHTRTFTHTHPPHTYTLTNTHTLHTLTHLLTHTPFTGTVTGLSRGVFAVDFSSDNEQVAIAGGDSSIRILKIGKERKARF